MKDIIWVIVSILLIVAMVGGCVALASHFTDGFTKNPVDDVTKPDNPNKPSGPDAKPTPDTPPVVADSEFVAYNGMDGTIMSDGNIHEVPGNIVFAAMPMAAETSSLEPIQLSCTVKPDDATDKRVNWEIAWVNSESAFSSGKAVTDYMTCEKSGEATCNITCKQAFGEKIKITVSSVSNPDAKDECIIDFASRIKDVTLTVGNTTLVSGRNTDKNIPFNMSSPVGITVNKTYDGPYTLEDTYTNSVSIGVNPFMLALYNFDPGAIELNMPRIFAKREGFGTLSNIGNSYQFDMVAFKKLFGWDKTDPNYNDKLCFFNGPDTYPAAFCAGVVAPAQRQQFVPMVHQRIIVQGQGTEFLNYAKDGQLVIKINVKGNYSNSNYEMKTFVDIDSLRNPVSNVTINQGNQVI